MWELENKKDVVLEDLRSLANKIDALNFIDISGYPKSCNEKILAAVQGGERIVKNLRDFALEVISPEAVGIYDDVVLSTKHLGINVSYSPGGIVKITLPCMLPHRKTGDNGFISVPLVRALEGYVSSRVIFKKFTNCDICITHVYDKNSIRREHIRDHDNFELKKIMDIIAMFLLTSDSGRYCNTHSFTELSDKNMTRIEIMNVDMFPQWISGHEKYKNHISI
jgi:hypothetical protein